MTNEKPYRLFELLKLLNTGRPNVESLATALGVSRRTILRDVEELRDIGFQIKFDQEMKRYILEGSVLLPTMQFTVDEALALLLLCFETGQEIPFLRSARMAAIKIQNVLPGKIQDNIREVNLALHLQPRPVNPLPGREALFDSLINAIRTRMSIRIRYKSPIEPEFDTLLSPYQLYFARHSWYVIGRSSLHREVRMFHLGRINRHEQTENSYEIPRGFTLKQFFGNAWSMIREPGRDQEVVVRFSPLVAQNVSEVAWHPTQRVLWNPDGSLDFFVTVSGLSEISWWILGYGQEAEVLKPPKLRQMIRKHIEEMLAKYSS